jgi:hypothetical protein
MASSEGQPQDQPPAMQPAIQRSKQHRLLLVAAVVVSVASKGYAVTNEHEQLLFLVDACSA